VREISSLNRIRQRYCPFVQCFSPSLFTKCDKCVCLPGMKPKPRRLRHIVINNKTGFDTPSVLYGIGQQMLDGDLVFVGKVRCLQYVGILLTHRCVAHKSRSRDAPKTIYT